MDSQSYTVRLCLEKTNKHHQQQHFSFPLAIPRSDHVSFYTRHTWTGGSTHTTQPLTPRATSIPSYPGPTEGILTLHTERVSVAASVTGCLSEPVISLKLKLPLITSFSVRQSGSSKWPGHSSALENHASSSARKQRKAPIHQLAGSAGPHF